MARRFSFQLNRRLSALTRRRVGLSLQDGELWAGEMSRPAGFSAGRGACARGGCSARRCFALARRNDIPLYRIVNCAAARRLCLPDIVPAQGYRARGAVRRGDVVLSVCFAFGSFRACVPLGMSRVRFVPGVRSYRNVLRSIHAGRAFLSECPAFDHACCLPHSAKQDGLRYLAFLFRHGSRSPFVRSRGVGAVIYLGGFTSGLFVYLWRSRRGYRGHEERGWRRSVSALLRNHIGFAMFSAGSTLGLRAPDCAKESKVEAALPPLWTLFTLRRDCLGAYSQRLCAFAQPHQPC